MLVSSGAVASGRREITLKKEEISVQAGFGRRWTGNFDKHISRNFGKNGIKIAQALLTNHDFMNRKSYITTRNIMDMLSLGVVPIINENDVTTYDELKSATTTCSPRKRRQ